MLKYKTLFDDNASLLSDNSYEILQNHESTQEINYDIFLDKEISLDELERAMKNLNNNKSPGSDNIINEFLKYNTPLMKQALLCIFNNIFKKGYFPEAWTVGLITPIYKKRRFEFS